MKYWIITAIVLTVVGGALFLFSFGAVGFDFSVLNEESLDMKLYRVEEPFHSISLEDDIADVTFVAATESKVEYTESDGITYSVSVSDGVLRIRANDRRKWYHYLTGFPTSRRSVTVYLSETEYLRLKAETDTGNLTVSGGITFQSAELSTDTGTLSFSSSVTESLKLETDTGDILLQSATLGSLKLETDTGDTVLKDLAVKGSLSVETDTGDLSLSDVTCGTLYCEGETSDVTLTDVVASVRMTLKLTTGDLFFTSCDAPDTEISTSTGDVTGSFRGDRIYTVTSKSGSVSHPESAGSNRCKVTTRSGDVVLTELKGN